METGNNKPLPAIEIVSLLPPLNKWSMRGMQYFIESGVFSDLVAAVSRGNSRIYITSRRVIISCPVSEQAGTVTLAQMKRILDSLPLKDSDSWDLFISCFSLWSASSSWWDTPKLSWEIRDRWRQAFGLDRINPILICPIPDPFEIVFRYVGKGEVWKNAPEGYRYASFDEVKVTGVPKGYERSTCIPPESYLNLKSCWGFTDGHNLLPVCDEYVTRAFRDGFIYDASTSGSNVLVPLVKL